MNESIKFSVVTPCEDPIFKAEFFRTKKCRRKTKLYAATWENLLKGIQDSGVDVSNVIMLRRNA